MSLELIEITNNCNLKCVYCPHRLMKREKDFMCFNVFEECVKLFMKDPAKDGIMKLFGFGEPLLHPQLDYFIIHAQEEFKKIGKDHRIMISTNGVLLSMEVLLYLISCGLTDLIISLHIGMEKKNTAFINRIREEGIDKKLKSLLIYDRENNHDFAGQLDEKGKLSANIWDPTRYCIYRDSDSYIILVNGNINTCCVSVEDQNTGYTVGDLLQDKKYQFKSIDLCSKCCMGPYDWSERV